ncbi:MAG: hypothetical protein K5840_04930 [Eubacterium sp.]|nr:hypothetical protein [Eubacterium sp.]
MITTVKGGIYNLPQAPLDELVPIITDFFSDDNHADDLICITFEDGLGIYVNQASARSEGFRDSLATRMDSPGTDDCRLVAGTSVFRDAYLNPYIKDDGVIPVLDSEGNPLFLVKYFSTFYSHRYHGDRSLIDTRIFKDYDSIVLKELNEFSFLILTECLQDFDGTVILYGDEWDDFLNTLSLQPYELPLRYIVTNDGTCIEQYATGKTMFLGTFLSRPKGAPERAEAGIFSYDEAMIMLYCFCVRESRGEDFPENRYFIIDGGFSFLGLFAMTSNVSETAAFIAAQGYIPLVRITSSDRSIYSDYPGDDIWGKFFGQPAGHSLEEAANAKSVTLSPPLNTTYGIRYLMKKISRYDVVELGSAPFYNDAVRTRVDDAFDRFLPHPEKTLGVLIRGTDYTANKRPNHSIMASPEMIIDKIREIESERGSYEYIFCSTEDEEALTKMKEAFGERLLYTDQRRYTLRPGQYLRDIENVEGQSGFDRGVEYLITIRLLSECRDFLASGNCAGTGNALTLNAGRYEHSYVFDLGVY